MDPVATNPGNVADTVLIIVNAGMGLCGAFGGFILKKLNDEIGRNRENIRDLYKLNASTQKELSEAKLETAKNYVTNAAIDDIKTEFFRRCDKIDDSIEKLRDVIVSQSSSRARP